MNPEAEAPVVAGAPSLSSEELVVLAALGEHELLRPMDVGGHDGSHHSRTLAKLVTKGLAERQSRGSLAGIRPGWLYRRTATGTALLEALSSEDRNDK